MTNASPECMHKASAILGEGPVWHSEHGALYWIDILQPAVFRFVPGKGQTGNWPMPSAVGAIGICGHNRLIVALEHEAICLLDLTSGDLQPLVDPLVHNDLKSRHGRFNDGGVDALGNFWVGWLTHDRKRPGALFRVEPSGSASQVLGDLIAPNGLGWSPDGRIMYVTDSHTNVIWAYDCDLRRGTLGAKRAIANQKRELGVFDGLCVDAGGNIWTALYGGGAVLQLTPEGVELQKIKFPVHLVTSCTFGGDELKTLMVTSAVRDQSPDQLTSQPLAGSLFCIALPEAGMMEFQFPI